MTPRFPEEGKLRANSRGPGPLWGSGTSPRPSRPPTRVEPIYRRGGVRGCHVSRRCGRGRESSAGRLAHPPHSMRVVETCSAAADRGAAFVRPHCKPHITEVHSAAACAASAQSPSTALNGYDGTVPFHHTAYAASYTARSATQQATASYAASYALAPFRQDRAWLCRTEDSHGWLSTPTTTTTWT